jgi:hypothetical protein
MNIALSNCLPGRKWATRLASTQTLAALLLALTISAARDPGKLPTSQPVAPTVSQAIRIEEIDRPDVPLRGFIVRVDLSNESVRVRCVPGGDKPATLSRWPTELQTVSHVAEREGFDLAINGDFFGAEKAKDAEGAAALHQFVVGRRACPVGVSVTDGRLWSKAAKPVPMLVVSHGEGGEEFSIRRGTDAPPDAQQVISGQQVLVWAGEVQEKGESDRRHPRTAVGLTQDRRTLILVVVDGRSIRSRGASLPELARICKDVGAHEAINLDGGGSTTLVRSDRIAPPTQSDRASSTQPDKQDAGSLHVLNSPSDGQQRPVVNVLGIELR